MAFLEILKEMLSRQEVADLSKNVTLVSVDRENEKNPRKFLNLAYAKNGEVEWEGPDNASLFMMKGKIIRDILPKIKDKVGQYRFVDRDRVREEIGHGSHGAIQTDEPVRTTSLGRASSE
jgi:hypothetical protein